MTCDKNSAPSIWTDGSDENRWMDAVGKTGAWFTESDRALVRGYRLTLLTKRPVVFEHWKVRNVFALSAEVCAR
jgi:hypothetical protein